MEIDNHPPSSSVHTSEGRGDSLLVPPSSDEDYVSYYTFSSSVPNVYRKESEDDCALQPTLDYGSLQVLPEPYKTYRNLTMLAPFPEFYASDALNDLLDLDMPPDEIPPHPSQLHHVIHHSHSANHLHPLTPSSPSCSSCGSAIDDPLMLAVAGRKWHERCLRCCVCSTSLESAKSCFERGDSIYCKGCYDQEFTTKCAGCDRSISPSDWVRRARSNVYHIACFGCNQCKRQLSTGEEFAIQENKLLCKQHYLELVEGESATSKQKTKRVRTTFTDEQINVLQTHFQIDSNPDGADLERIAQQTGLSKRVTQVWFQNSRARQKKYSVKKPGTHGHTDSLPSSEDPLSPRSEASSDECSMYPHSVTTNLEETMCTTNLPHRMDMMGMGLQTIDYD